MDNFIYLHRRMKVFMPFMGCWYLLHIHFAGSYPLAGFGHIQNFELMPPDNMLKMSGG